MEKKFKYYFKTSGMLFGIYLVFAIIGMILFAIPDSTGGRIATVCVGLLVYGCIAALTFFIGRSDGRKAKNTLLKKGVEIDGTYAPERYSPVKAYLIPLYAAALPVLLLAVGIICRGEIAHAMTIVTGVYYGSFSAFLVGAGVELFTQPLWNCLFLLIPITLEIVLYAGGYFFGAAQAQRTHDEIRQEVDIFSRS